MPPRKTLKDSKTVCVILTEEQRDDLDQIAQMRGISRSEVARDAIGIFLRLVSKDSANHSHSIATAEGR